MGEGAENFNWILLTELHILYEFSCKIYILAPK